MPPTLYLPPRHAFLLLAICLSDSSACTTFLRPASFMIAGTHLETRVLALLRKLETAATLPSVTLGRAGKAGSNARGVVAGYGKQSTLGFQRTGAQPPNKRRRTAAAEPEPVASHASAPSA